MAKKHKSADAEPEVVHPDDAPEIEETPTETPEDTEETTEEEIEETEEVAEDHKPTFEAKPKNTSDQNFFQKFWAKYTSNKKVAIPATIVVLLAVFFAVPFTRYKALGLFIKKNFAVTVLDNKTGKPVSEAQVTIAGKSAKTDGEGKATVNDIAVGNQKLTVAKKYYHEFSATVLVSLSDGKNSYQAKPDATGRQVPVTVVNKVTGKGIKGAAVTVLDTESETDDKGEAVVVIPADKSAEKVTVKLQGYNDTTAEIEVTEQQVDKNKLSLTPAGKVYFLSKKSGKLDVVKTDLDGGNRQVVLSGTGKEKESDTILLASRDWKYLALKSARDGKAKLFFIDTGSDKISVMDEGDADFQMTGWADQHFVYKVVRNKPQWEAKREAIKSFNATNKSLTTIQESVADGSASSYKAQSFGRPYIITGGRIVYSTAWSSSGWGNTLGDRQIEIIQAKAGTSEKKSLRGLPIPNTTYYASVSEKAYDVDEIYYAQYVNNAWKFYEYEDGAVKDTNETNDETFFSKFYPTYIQSPSTNTTFWYEPRDGKNTLFLGDKKGDNSVEIGSLTEMIPYGWYSEDYLLVSKKDSELYILGRDKDAPQLKVTDYHKPSFDSRGYGGGYGGF